MALLLEARRVATFNFREIGTFLQAITEYDFFELVNAMNVRDEIRNWKGKPKELVIFLTESIENDETLFYQLVKLWSLDLTLAEEQLQTS